MTKLPTFITIAAVSAIAGLGLSTSASAQDAGCPADTTPVASAGGPLCVEDHYLHPPAGVVFADPALCQWGYYQGSCAPEPAPAVDLGEAAYAFQTPDPAIAHAPAVVRASEPIVAPLTTLWLTRTELHLADLHARR